MQHTAVTATVVFDATSLKVSFAPPPSPAPEGQKNYPGTYVHTKNGTKMPCTLVAQVQCDTLHLGTDCILPKALHIPDYPDPPKGTAGIRFVTEVTVEALKPSKLKPDSVAKIVAFFPALQRHICVSMEKDDQWWFCASLGVPRDGQNCISGNSDAPLSYATMSPRSFRLPVHGLQGNQGMLSLSDHQNGCARYSLAIFWPFDAAYTQTLTQKMRRFIEFGHMYPSNFKCNGVKLLCVVDDPASALKGVYDGTGDYNVYVVYTEGDPKDFEAINLVKFEQDNKGTNFYGMIAVRTECNAAMRPVRPTTAIIGRAPPVAVDSNCPGPCISIGGRSVTYSGPLTHNSPHHGA